MSLYPAGPPAPPTGSQTSMAVILAADPAATALLGSTRHAEMQDISDRLGHMSKRNWDRVWGGAAILFFGGTVGGSIGLVPFWNTQPPPSYTTKEHYIALLAFSLVLAILCGLARLSTKSERDDSCEAIKASLDKILGAYAADLQAQADKREKDAEATP